MKPDLEEIKYLNRDEFLSIRDEIFNKEIYRFSSESKSPLIIDAGAHIGLASIYFKSLYPDARIVAFEPNPEVFALLEENISTLFGEDSVELRNRALAGKPGNRDFYIDSTDTKWDSTAGFIEGTWKGGFQSEKIIVEAEVLSTYITEPIDLIKLDIEGAELKVLEEIESRLHMVKKLFIESHPINENQHNNIIKLLKRNRYSIKLWNENYQISEPLNEELIIIEATLE